MKDRLANQILDDARLDRLVDGELAPAEHKSLLAALDEDPALWRRCALAFLEAQAWRGEMSAIRRGDEPAHASPPAAPPAAGRQRRWLHRLAIAASFVVAFAAGLAVQRQFDRQRDAAAIAGNQVPRRGALDRHVSPDDESFPASTQEPRSIGNIRLVVDGAPGSTPQKIDVPVYDLNQVGAQWLTQDRPVLPDDVIASLLRRGRKVERQIEYLPLPLDEEHQILLPVEQIQITPVSRGSY